MSASANPGDTGRRPLHPSTVTVIDLVARLVESNVPTGEAERRQWFRDFRLLDAPADAEPADSRAGDAPTDRHDFRGEFVEVDWFLWAGHPREVVREAANELVDGFTVAFGPSFDGSEPTRVGSAAFWRANGWIVQVYFHSGLPPEDINRPESDAVVQLAVEHEKRSRAEDREAQSPL